MQHFLQNTGLGFSFQHVELKNWRFLPLFKNIVIFVEKTFTTGLEN